MIFSYFSVYLFPGFHRVFVENVTKKLPAFNPNVQN